jgi:hypothetical protein
MTPSTAKVTTAASTAQHLATQLQQLMSPGGAVLKENGCKSITQ